MSLTPERRASLLAYCRIDELEPEDEGLLEVLYSSAVSYLEQAGVSEPEAGTPRAAQYSLCVNALVLDAWDRRGTSASERGTYTTVENRAFRLLLNQLKLTEPIPVPPAEASTSGPRLTEPSGSPSEPNAVGPVGRAEGSGAAGGSGEAAPGQSGAFDGGVSDSDTSPEGSGDG